MVLTLREPARMINSDSTDEFTLRLLRSADADQPPLRAVSRAMVRVTALLAGDQNLVVAARVREVFASGKRRRRTGTLRVTRAAGLGLLLGTSLAAAVVGVTQTRPEIRQPNVLEAVKPVTKAPIGARRAPQSAILERAQTNEALTPSTAPSTAGPIQLHESRPAKVPNNDLGRELSLLDAAKAALSSNDPRGALRALDDSSRLQHRALVPEATVLRVRALVAMNRMAAARQLVERFVAESPNSPVNPVLRNLVAPLEKP